MKKNKASYDHCLNCQTELQGEFCHACGQHATKAKPTVKEFLLEYLNIVFIWDTHFIKTIWQMLRRPGHVTKEYVSGKFISYTHPLKLNMFLLFIFITIFLLFHKDLGNSIQNITRDEINYPLIKVQILTDDEEYSEAMKSGPLDTVQLYAPLLLAESFPDIVTAIDETEGIRKDSLMVWTAALPHKLIEDEVIISDDKDYYYFNDKDKTGVIGAEIIESIWNHMVKLTTNYFPVFILLTVPFLAFILRLTQRKGDHSKFKHFIFALHYTAFLEMLIILLYITKLIADTPGWLMQLIMLTASFVYLTLSIKTVYETKKWHNAAAKAVLTSMGYAFILLLVLLGIFIISLGIVVVQM